MRTSDPGRNRTAGLWTATNKMLAVADTQYRGLAGMGGRATLTTNGWDPAEASVAQLAYESPATDINRDFVQAPANLSYGNKVERRKIHRIVYGEREAPDEVLSTFGPINLLAGDRVGQQPMQNIQGLVAKPTVGG